MPCMWNDGIHTTQKDTAYTSLHSATNEIIQGSPPRLHQYDGDGIESSDQIGDSGNK